MHLCKLMTWHCLDKLIVPDLNKGFELCLLQDKSGEFVSVLQCNNAPSSRTPRGHQFPAAFMMQVIICHCVLRLGG